MLTTILFSLLASSAALASPTALARQTTACHVDPVLPQYGLFGGVTSQVIHWGLDERYELVAPARGHAVIPSFNATFEVCPALGTATNSNPQLESPTFGRILLTPSIGGDNTCLTISNPEDAGTGNPLFAQVAQCTDATTPSANQTWVYGYLSDYGAMYWVGDADTPGHEDGYGFVVDLNNDYAVQTDALGHPKILQDQNVYPPADGLWVVDFEFY